MAILDQVNALIDDARAAADNARLTAENQANLAIAAAQTAPDPQTITPFVDRWPVTALVFDEPEEWKQIVDQDETAFRQEIIDQLKTEFDLFMSTWFPSTLADASTNWLENAIDNGGTGILPAVESAIWNRARDREEIQRDGELSEVTTRSARAGWHIPPGALQKQIQTVRDNNAAQIGSVSRDAAIKAADQEQQNVQFAVNASIQLQNTVFNAATAFIGVLTAAYDPAMNKTRTLNDATREFYNVTNDYNRIRIANEEIGIKWAEVGVREDLNFEELLSNSGHRRAEAVTAAATASAASMGDIAAAALSSQNTMASLDSAESTEL